MPDPLPLDYRRSDTSLPKQHSAVLAFLLCAPGALTFVLYFVGCESNGLPTKVIDAIGNIFWPLLILAIATAIGSTIFYTRHSLRPFPWYVRLNLVINIAGLIFAAAGILPNL